MLICFISLPLWAVFVALARGDLIIISPMGQVVNIIFQVFCYFFWKFLFFHQESQCLCGFAAVYIYNKISHFAEFYCIFCIFSLFLSTLFRWVLHLWQHLFYNRTSCKALSITPRDFLFYKKQKTAGAAPAFVSFILFIYYL